MKLTIILFSKMGAMLNYKTGPVEDIQTVDKLVSAYIKAFDGTQFNSEEDWSQPDENYPTLKDAHGWVKTKISKNGTRAVVIFYKGK